MGNVHDPMLQGRIVHAFLDDTGQYRDRYVPLRQSLVARRRHPDCPLIATDRVASRAFPNSSHTRQPVMRLSRGNATMDGSGPPSVVPGSGMSGGFGRRRSRNAHR